MKKKIQETFYQRNDVNVIARELIGKVLCSNISGKYCSGMITEAEAYDGIYDRACHAFQGRRTARTETMFAEGGVTYVYWCYGIHALLNVVTNKKDVPDAVLLRAIYPIDGIELIKKRRGGKIYQDGPGKLSKALKIHTDHGGLSLQGDVLWIEDRGYKVPEKEIYVGPRIGCESAGEAGLYPYRYLLKDLILIKNLININ